MANRPKYKREELIQERLERENRELKHENKRLARLVKKLDRGFKRTLDAVEEHDGEVPQEVMKLCFQCGGEYKEVIVANRRFRLCQDCGKRGKVTVL